MDIFVYVVIIAIIVSRYRFKILDFCQLTCLENTMIIFFRLNINVFMKT